MDLRTSFKVAWIGAVVGAAWTSYAAAQTVQGRVTIDDPAATAIEGALISLTDASGERVAGVFSNAEGIFRLIAGAPGTYTITIERIGFATWSSEPLSLALDQELTVAYAIPIEPVRLAQLDVSVYRGCFDDPRRAEELYAVWDEARKALEAAQLAQQEQLLRFDSIVFDRERLGRSFEFAQVVTTAARGTPETPFQSLDADALSADGYIQSEGETIYFYAPDAGVLLSDTFLEDHCFGLDRARIEGREYVGLTFEPVDGRELPDIEGVLWIDQETAELDHVEFEYREVPFRGVDEDDIGGRIDFRRLPTGAFVVDDWVITMPVMVQNERDQRRDRYQVVGFTEHGGELRRVFSADGEVVPWRRGASVTGVVVNPLTDGPLSDATIRLDRPRGSDVARHTGPDGEFLFEALDEGKHELTVSHPILDLIDSNQVHVDVELQPGQQAELVFELPAPEDVVRRYCRDHPNAAAVIGQVVNEAHAFPMYGVRVWLEFDSRTGRERPGERAAGPRMIVGEVRTNRVGRFVLCGVPLDVEGRLYVATPDDMITREVATTRRVLVMEFAFGGEGSGR